MFYASIFPNSYTFILAIHDSFTVLANTECLTKNTQNSAAPGRGHKYATIFQLARYWSWRIWAIRSPKSEVGWDRPNHPQISQKKQINRPSIWAILSGFALGRESTVSN